MIRIYSTISNIILDFITPKITILINFIKKTLKIDKGIYIVIIYKYTDIIYFIVGSFRIFTILTTVSTTIFEPLSPI